jgi:hypothetical protein
MYKYRNVFTNVDKSCSEINRELVSKRCSDRLGV